MMRGPTDPIRQMPAPAVGEAPNAGRDWRTWARNLGVAAAAGVFLALSGAMDTSNTPLTTRLLYWAPLMIAGAAVANLLAGVVAKWMPPRANQWLFGAALAVAIAAALTLPLMAFTNLVYGTAMGLSHAPGFFFSVLLIAAPMTGVMVLVNRPGPVTHAPPPGAAPAQVRFMERLPAKLKGAVIYAVQAEDHYLRLHTSKGSDLILMRLADAVVELEGLEGAQTHRSWWVAREAVEGARRDGDRMVLTLKGGAEAPVSRPNIRPLREAGWY